MTRLGLLLAGVMFTSPAFAQTMGSCPGAVGAGPEEKPTWVMFDLGSAALKPEFKPAIAQAVATAKARKSIKVCVLGQTDKLGDKNYNAKLAQARAQAVASELIHAGYPAKDVIIAVNPEAFGNVSFGGNDASEKDRRATIVLR
jgi:outer membrane protein OmpA-like peptidoglycan-associated protein